MKTCKICIHSKEKSTKYSCKIKPWILTVSTTIDSSECQEFELPENCGTCRSFKSIEGDTGLCMVYWGAGQTPQLDKSNTEENERTQCWHSA
jgi:hypothetical protein